MSSTHRGLGKSLREVISLGKTSLPKLEQTPYFNEPYRLEFNSPELAFTLSRNVRRVLTNVIKRCRAETYFDTPVDRNHGHTQEAYCKLRSNSVSKKTAETIITGLCKRAGAEQYGDQPILAADTMIHLQGKQIDSARMDMKGQTIDPESTYIVMVMNKKSGKVCFTGGYTHPLCNFDETGMKEMREESNPRCTKKPKGLHNNKLFHFKGFAGHSSHETRATSERDKHIITAYGLVTVESKTKWMFEGGDDAERVIFVRVADRDGEPLTMDQITSEMTQTLKRKPQFRQDHFNILAERQSNERNRRAHEKANNKQAQSVLQRLNGLKDVPVVRSGFRMTPDYFNKGKGITYNKWLAAQIITESLICHNETLPNGTKASSANRRIVEQHSWTLLKQLGKFVPEFPTPQPTVDTILIGTGDHANDISLYKQPDSKWRLPGKYMTSDDSDLLSAAQNATSARCDSYLGNAQLITITQGIKHKKLRDRRGNNPSFVFIGIGADQRSKTPLNVQRMWVPLLNKDRSDLSSELNV